MPSLLQATCLSPKRSLRTQLFSSFGLAAFLSLFVVVLSSCIAIHKSGKDVKRYSEDLMTVQVQQSLLRSSELVAEKYSARISSVEGTLQLLVEAIQDRICGYPNMPGWEEGIYVPFRDHYYTGGAGENISNSTTNSGRQQFMYPLSQPPAPLDWSVTPEKPGVYSDARISVYSDMLKSTQSASYHMPWSCDVSNQYKVLGCAEANNNVTTGGKFPSKTHEGIYRATGDLSVFMKPLYEADPELLKLSILFFNEGAGTTLQYPAGPIAPSTPTYISSGCDWMVQMENPYTGRPYGTIGEVSKCRYQDIEVKSHEYNSMEAGTAEYILRNGPGASKTPTINHNNSNGVAWQGPLLASDNSTVILRAGKAVYDRLTRELIGFVTADVLEKFLAMVLDTTILDVDAYVYVARYDDGRILSVSPNADYAVFEKLPQFDNIRTALDNELHQYYSSLEQSTGKGTKSVRQPIYIAPLISGGILTASFLPVPPKNLEDFQSYEPVAFVVQKMTPDVFAVVHEIESYIDSDVRKNTFLSVLLGIFGLVIILLILAGMSAVLTRPLEFITLVAHKIITNDYSEEVVGGTQEGSKDDKNDEDGSTVGKGKLLNFDNFFHKPSSRCAPKTEVFSLVHEFQRMIEGFSGEGASEVAEPSLSQIRNELTWHSGFAKLYDPEGLSKKSFRQTSISTETSHTEASRMISDTTFESLGHIHDFNPGDVPVGTLASDYIESQSDLKASEIEEVGLYRGENSEAPPNVNEDKVPMFRATVMQQPVEDQLCDPTVEDSFPIHLAESRRFPVPIPEDHSETFSSEPLPRAGSRHHFPRLSFLAPAPGTQPVIPAPAKINRFPVLGAPKSTGKPMVDSERGAIQRSKDVCCSSLFWWIVVLMALPVFLTNVIIGGIVTTSISGTIPVWTQTAELASISIESEALQFIADRKASILSTLIQAPVRDLHFMTRITNWLFFGGLNRSVALINVDSATEECKTFIDRDQQCPVFTPERMPCLCGWKCQQESFSPWGCQQANISDSRYLQRQGFSVQKLDFDPLTGNRQSSPSFPELANSPETTSWWQDIASLPGAEKGPGNASGYDTLYDRVAVSSACSVFNFPNYNYATALSKDKQFLGGYASFEADGLFMGWTGCHYSHMEYAGWKSSLSNGAPLIDSNLCPDGKYGYDPRCRSWYDKGKKKYQDKQIPVHVTAPYLFATGGVVASSITSPISNPETKEYIGQVLLDYLPIGLGSSVEMLDEPISFLITPDEDVVGGDTVVGPNLNKTEEGWKASPIGDLLFLRESVGSKNRENFENKILPLMKGGSRGQQRFVLTNQDGYEEEICLAFAPVVVRNMLAMNPSRFADGIKPSESLVYSIAVGKPCQDIQKPFDRVEDDVNQDLESIGLVYLSLNVVATFLFVVFSAVAAAYIAFPMIKLLNIVKNSNNGDYETLPPLEGGCKEVHGVYNTFSKLNKIVKVSNTSFFSGNLEMAHHFVRDALSLFRKIDDQKAIGIACNNLANTLFAIRFEERNYIHCCESGTKCMFSESLSLYDSAVEFAQQDFDKVPEGDLKVAYATQLADRLFNRGLYLLFIDGYECAPLDSRERGYHDVTLARNLHYDIRDYMLAHRQLFANAPSYFSRLLRRINCLAAFYDDVGLREIWDAEELLDEADQLASAALEASSKGCCPLFRDVNPTGRRQQLESSAILLALRSDDFVQAAKLGIRMLVEDCFILESSFARAAEALLAAMKEEIGFSRKTVIGLRDNLRTMLKSCRNVTLDIGKNAIFVFEMDMKWAGSPLLDELNARCLELYDTSFSPDDQIGVVASNVKDSMAVELGTKEDNEGRQRAHIDVATSSVTSDEMRASLPIGLQMLIDSATTYDSFVILVTDGSAQDAMDFIAVKNQIERLNTERSHQIHVLILGLDISDTRRIGLFEELASVSKSSMFVNAGINDLEHAFQSISTIINGQLSNQFISFLTMEKF